MVIVGKAKAGARVRHPALEELVTVSYQVLTCSQINPGTTSRVKRLYDSGALYIKSGVDPYSVPPVLMAQSAGFERFTLSRSDTSPSSFQVTRDSNRDYSQLIALEKGPMTSPGVTPRPQKKWCRSKVSNLFVDAMSGRLYVEVPRGILFIAVDPDY